MCDTNKNPADIFFVNLAAITGAGSLVKLNLTNDLEMERRFDLVERRNRKLDTYAAAVMVYFHDVLGSKGFDKSHPDKERTLIGIADVLTTAWVLFDSGRILPGDDVPYKSIESLSKWLDSKLKEVFSFGLDTALRPTAESLKYILKDFERISNVSDVISGHN